MGILDTLRNRKTAKDLADALPEIARELSQLSAKLTGLKTSLRSAPFEATPAEVTALRGRIRAVEDEIETLEAVEEETRSRIEAVERADADAELFRNMQSARSARDAMRKAAKEFDRAVLTMAEAGAKMRANFLIVEEANRQAVAAGHEDLRLRVPLFRFEFGTAGNRAERSEAILALKAMSPTKQFDEMEKNDRL